MKRIWTILSVLAVANVLALGGFVGWLVQSDRLNKERVQRVRTMLAQTISAEKAALDAETVKVEAAKAEAAAAEKLAQPPVPASQVIAASIQQQDADVQTTLRKQRELEDLRSSLLRLQANLEDREKALAQRETNFEDTKKRYAQIEGAEQFKTALTTLEGQKAKDAKSVLQSLLSIGQTEQVVAYLARMDEGKRSKVMAEFVKDSPSVAADLLERLRTRGAEAAKGESGSNDTSNRTNNSGNSSAGTGTGGQPGTGAPGAGNAR